MADADEESSVAVAPLPTLPRLPAGVTPDCTGGSWGAAVSNGAISKFFVSLAFKAVIAASVVALAVVMLRPLPIKEAPLLDYTVSGHNALHGAIAMPRQFNRTDSWGSKKPLPKAPGEALHVAMLVAHANQEFPSLYEGAPAEPRLSQKGMVDAFNLGAAVRERLRAEGLLRKEPSPVEATAQSIDDGRARDTANAFLFGLLPINVRDMWRQSKSHADCNCRDEPYDIPYDRETPNHGWRMDADVFCQHSATKVACLASCMGLNIRGASENGVTADDIQVQPVQVKVAKAAEDVVLRQFSTCRSAKVDIQKEINSDKWYHEERHKYEEILNIIRHLKIPEVCVSTVGSQKCDHVGILDFPTLNDVLRAHIVHEQLWQKDQGVNRKYLSYEVFLGAEWVQHQLFKNERGDELGSILLGEILTHWHEQLVLMDDSYSQTVMDQAAFAPQNREFERWNRLLFHQNYDWGRGAMKDTHFHLYAGHRWQVLAFLAALEWEDESAPLPEDLSHVTLTLRSLQGGAAHIQAHGLDASKLVVEVQYCVGAAQCGRMPLKGCPGGFCPFKQFLHHMVGFGRAIRNPNHLDDAARWNENYNLQHCPISNPEIGVAPRPKKRGKHGRRLE